MTCDGEPGGCFIIKECYRSSATFSTRMIYSLEKNKLKVFNLTYQNDNCAGELGIHPMSWSDWDITLSNINQDTGEADIEAAYTYYGDGYILGNNRPSKDTKYQSKLWVDSNGDKSRLCLSEGLIEATRPVMFMSTTAQPLDTNNCAIELK